MSNIRALKEFSILKTGPFGTQFKASEYVSEGIPVINVKNIGYGDIVRDNLDYISERTRDRLSEHVLQCGDIVFGRKGSVDRHCLISKAEDGWFQGSDCLRVRITDPAVNPQYVSYYLLSSHILKSINNAAVGSTMASINMDIIGDIKIIIPAYETQCKIAAVLKKLDDKRAINTAVNDNLQQQLKLLYDYWFTQFDFPDENGKPYRSSGGQMVRIDGVAYPVPKEWKVESVFKNSISSIIKPGIDPFDSKIYLATAEVNGTAISTGSVIEYATRESRANMQPTVNSVWFAKMKKSIKHLFLNSDMIPLIEQSILSTGFCGLQCSQMSFEYIASFIEHSYFETIKDTLAHGATQEAVNNDDLAGINLIIPSERVLSLYHERTKGIYSQISKNICENQELTRLRDWLLPMLMNGQATIED